MIPTINECFVSVGVDREDALRQAGATEAQVASAVEQRAQRAAFRASGECNGFIALLDKRDAVAAGVAWRDANPMPDPEDQHKNMADRRSVLAELERQIANDSLLPKASNDAGAEPRASADAPEVESINMGAAGLTKREQKIRTILAGIQARGWDVNAIPEGGKSELRTQLMATHSALFGGGPSPFNDAWKAASTSKRLRVFGYQKYFYERVALPPAKRSA